MADVIYSVGADAARDYSTQGAAIADIGVGIPADFVTADTNVIFEVYNDNGAAIAESPITIPTITTDATRFLTIRPASGTGALGHPNDHTTRGTSAALRYDPALGAALEMSAGYSPLLADTGNQKVVIERLQLKATGIKSRPITFNGFGTGSLIDACILETAHASGQITTIRGTGSGEIRNTVVVQNTSDKGGMNCDYISLTCNNCTFVATNNSNDAAMSRGFGSGTLTLNNCISFGFALAPSSNDGLVMRNNATDLTVAVFGGTNTIGSLTPANELENVTLASFDARAKSTGSLPDAADASYAPTLDILGQTRDASPTIGAYELLAAGGTVAEETLTAAMQGGVTPSNTLTAGAGLALAHAAAAGPAGGAVAQASVTAASVAAYGAVGGLALEAAMAAAMAAGHSVTMTLSYESVLALTQQAGAGLLADAAAEAALVPALNAAIQAVGQAAAAAGLSFSGSAGVTASSDVLGLGFTTPDGRSVTVSVRIGRDVTAKG